jgi:hypothetical protein
MIPHDLRHHRPPYFQYFLVLQPHLQLKHHHQEFGDHHLHPFSLPQQPFSDQAYKPHMSLPSFQA